MTCEFGVRRTCRVGLLPVLGLAAAVAIAGCGVPEDATDRPVSKAEVEFGLLDPIATTTTTTTTTTRVPPSSIVLPTTTIASDWLKFYLIQNQRLVLVRRPALSDVTIAAVLDALKHPTFEETIGGRRSELADLQLVVSAEAQGGSATVELGDGFSSLLGSDQLLAIGQIVYSLTGVDGIGSVAFSLGGSPLEVPGVDGGLIRGPVSRDDLISLVATPVTTTTPSATSLTTTTTVFAVHGI